MILSFKSLIPPKGSVNSPKWLWFKHIAKAFIVKSRRFWSSVSVPFSTIGLRESLLYDSLRAPTNSTSKFLYLT